MSDSAFQTMYRQEYIQSFERRQSLLRECVTTEAVIKGTTAVFLVAGSGGATATTRGINGQIPARADDQTQLSCQLAEWHDLVRKTGFNVFGSQGDQRRMMQETTMAVVNRKIDSLIISQLETGTNDTGAAKNMSLSLAMYAKTILGNNDAGGGNVYAAITPAAEAFLMQTTEFSNAQYVDVKPFAQTNPQISGRFQWAGVEWTVHTGLTGLGTAAEKCLMWNKMAIGQAADTKGLQTPVGYMEEQDYSYARASIFMGAKALQNSGIVVINHDGSSFAAQ